MRKKYFLRSFLISCGIASAAASFVCFSNDVQASTNGKTAEDAITWVKSKVGVGIDFDKMNGNQCVDLIKAYYSYLGQAQPYGNGGDYTKNVKPDGWKRLSKNETKPRKGDILVYTGGYGGYGHVAIYESDNSHYHQNWDGSSCVVRVTYRYDADYDVKYWGVIRPDFVASKKTTQTSAKKVAVAGISLKNTQVTLKPGEAFSLSATIKPSNATNKSVTWSSSNSSVAKVDKKGKVTAGKPGTATISVKTTDGGKVAKAVIKVQEQLKGLVYSKGVWSYYKNGKVDTSYIGLVYHNNVWWYVKNGKLDKSYTGLTYHNKTWWYVKNGKLDKSYTGLTYHDKTWWYVKNGRLDKSFTGLTYHNKNWFFVNSGKLDKSFTGLRYHNGKWYYIVKGKWAKTYNGKVKNNGKTYTVKNGKVV